MSLSILDERKLTERDAARLRRLAAGGNAPELLELLNDADVVPATDIGRDVVTMHARVIVFDAAIQRRRIVTLCYPHEADATRGRVSVLSPMGLSLIGLEAGASAAWQGADGAERVVTVEAVLDQPDSGKEARS